MVKNNQNPHLIWVKFFGSSYGGAHGCTRFPSVSKLSEVIITSFFLMEVTTKYDVTRTEEKEKQN